MCWVALWLPLAAGLLQTDAGEKLVPFTALGGAVRPQLRAPVDAGQKALLKELSAQEVTSAGRARAPEMMAQGNRGELRVRLAGVGAAAPETRVPNTMLEGFVDTDDAWITQRTGIGCRHLLKPDEGLADLATLSAERALASAGVAAEDVDLVVLATSSPDDMFGDAAAVAQRIGAKNAVAFDLTAACSGFLFSLNTASQFLHNGAYKTALVIGGDALSRWVDWSDRNTCVLFGDGAGAVVVKAAEEGEPSGMLGYEMHSDGSGRCNLNLAYTGAEEDLGGITTVTNGAYKPIYMNGKEVFKFATTRVPNVVLEAMENAGVTADDVDWLLMHQANVRILESAAKKMGISMDKVIKNLDEFGNTSAGSIPLALDQAVREGKVKKGDVIVVAGFGAGLSWGAAVMRYG